MSKRWIIVFLTALAWGCGESESETAPTGDGLEVQTPTTPEVPQTPEESWDDDAMTGMPIDRSGDAGEEGGGSQCASDADCGVSNSQCKFLECVNSECVLAIREDGAGCGQELAPGVCIDSYQCKSGECEAVMVADKVPCTVPGVEAPECQITACMEGECIAIPDDGVEGQSCVSAGDTGACNTAACNQGACTLVPVEDGAACDDGTVCTLGAICEAGDCKSAIDSPCDDNSLCTLNDVCVDADCVGEPVDCSDGDDCTLDVCDPATGECSYANDVETPGCPYYDGDGDGIPEKDDNCPEANNTDQADWNADGVGDACAVNACITEGRASVAAAGVCAATPLHGSLQL